MSETRGSKEADKTSVSRRQRQRFQEAVSPECFKQMSVESILQVSRNTQGNQAAGMKGGSGSGSAVNLGAVDS